MQTEYVKSLGKTWDEMTMAEQATARYRAILELGKDALGDFTKTSGSYANQQRILQLQAENLKTAYGERLIPAATAFTQALNEMLEPAASVATITAKIGAADNTLMLVEKYKSLSKTVSDTSISSSALAEAQKELKTVKEQLISLSGGLITATENESDAFNSQVLNIEKLTASDKELLKAQLYAKIIEGNSALNAQNSLEKELNDSKATKEAARSSIDGQLDLFKDIQDEAELSIDNFIESLKQQADYVKEYNSNLKKAVEMGIDKGLIEGLSDGSARSAVILGELVKSTQSDIGKLNSAFSGLEIGKDEFASIIAGMNKGVTLGELGYNVTLGNDIPTLSDITAQTQLSSELKSTSKLEVTGKVTVEGVSDTGQLVGVTDVFADKLGDYLAQQSRRWPSAPSSNPYLAK